MVIACIALFAALSGGAYAALSKNSVTSKQIKNSSVLGKDIKNNTIKGKDVKESKLAQVPSALRADSAASADTAANATNADNAANAARVAGVEAVRVQPFTLTNGESREVLQRGAFTLTATCSINEGGDDFARVLIATSVDNAAFDGSDTTGDLDVATPAVDRTFADVQSTPTTTPVFDQESDGSAFAPDGTEILGQEVYSGINLPADGVGVCRFGGLYWVD